MLIALDWGTSSLRAMLLDGGGGVLERRERGWGILSLPEGGFEAACAGMTRGWPQAPAIACGMVGSAQGWREVPYVAAPAGIGEIVARLGRIVTASGTVLHLVPGVSGCDATGAPNVMRGEETQVLGAGGERTGTDDPGLVLLPGTHSKWVHVAGGRIGGFETFMTGELFAVLRGHSILGQALSPAGDGRALPPAGDTAASSPLSRDAFTRGLVAARASHQGIAPLLFSTRALVLGRRIRAAESLDYLSGLLIGDELRAGLASSGRAPCTLIGSAALVARYRLGLELFGAPAARVVEDAAAAGLWRIAQAARLMTGVAR